VGVVGAAKAPRKRGLPMCDNSQKCISVGDYPDHFWGQLLSETGVACRIGVSQWVPHLPGKRRAGLSSPNGQAPMIFYSLDAP
jgi:hypothetical protein